MDGHNSPQWANRVAAAGGLLVPCGFVVNAFLRGYGVTETLGYLLVNLGLMLGLWVGLGLSLIAVIALTGVFRGSRKVDLQIPVCGSDEQEMIRRIDALIKVNDDEDHRPSLMP